MKWRIKKYPHAYIVERKFEDSNDWIKYVAVSTEQRAKDIIKNYPVMSAA